MLASPWFNILLFLASIPLLVIASLWFWRVKNGRSIPKPGTARQGVIFHAAILAFYLWDAFTSSLKGNEVAAFWLYFASLNIGLALGLALAIDGIARKAAEQERDNWT